MDPYNGTQSWNSENEELYLDKQDLYKQIYVHEFKNWSVQAIFEVNFPYETTFQSIFFCLVVILCLGCICP